MFFGFVSGVDINQLLGVAKITSSTGDAQATAVFDHLKDWKLIYRTIAMYIAMYTTFILRKATLECTMVPVCCWRRNSGKKLLHLASHQNILELVLASIFRECVAVEFLSLSPLFRFTRAQRETINYTLR